MRVPRTLPSGGRDAARAPRGPTSLVPAVPRTPSWCPGPAPAGYIALCRGPWACGPCHPRQALLSEGRAPPAPRPWHVAETSIPPWLRLLCNLLHQRRGPYGDSVRGRLTPAAPSLGPARRKLSSIPSPPPGQHGRGHTESYLKQEGPWTKISPVRGLNLHHAASN